MSFTVLDLTNYTQWEEAIKQLPLSQQDIYFTPGYYSLYQNNNDGKACCFVYSAGNNLVVYPFLLNSVNQLGYDLPGDYWDIQGAYGYNGLLTSNQEQTFLQGFYQQFSQYCRDNNIITEFIRFHPVLANQVSHYGYATLISDRDTVIIDLSQGYEHVLMGQYVGKCRNMVRKAAKQNYLVDISSTPQAYQVFMQMYYSSMQRVNAEPEYYFSEAYFLDIASNLPQNSFAINLYKDNQPMAGALFFVMGNYAHYHLSGRSENCADNSVTNYLLDLAAKEAIARGAKSLHLGGGRTNQPDDSLLKFKKTFSPNTSRFYIGKKVHNQNIYEQVTHQWQQKWPGQAQKYSKLLQGYRHTKQQ